MVENLHRGRVVSMVDRDGDGDDDGGVVMFW
jgi:hypothetical protein